MKRITARTCFWPLAGVLCVTFALSVGLTYRSDHHCYAGTCGEWLFPLQARLHVVVWYMWISLSVVFLGFRALNPSLRTICSKSLGYNAPLMGKQLRLSGLLLVFWVCCLYGILTGIWWVRLRDYFHDRGQGLPGNGIVAAVALTGHFADVTTGMVLLPVSRHSALASFFKLSPTTIYTFHMFQAYVLFTLVIIHGTLYGVWTAFFNQQRDRFRYTFPVLNPTYLYDEVWPGDTSALGVWRASLIFTGIISSLIMLAMFLTSFPVVRRYHFNLFYFTHLLGIVAVILICLHASTMFYCTIPGLSMWFLDWGMRIYELRGKLNSQLTALGNGWYTLTVPLPQKRLSGCACHSPLAHFYIYHFESSMREIHPFTTITHLASKQRLMSKDEDDIIVQFLFRQSSHRAPSQAPRRKSTQWTDKLGFLIDEERLQVAMGPSDTTISAIPLESADEKAKYEVEISLRLEGPYFTPMNPEEYKTVVCLVAGTGLSGALAIAAAFQARNYRSTAPNPVAVSDPPTENGEARWSRCIVIWTVRENDYVEIPFFKSLQCEGLEFRVHKTGGAQARPDMTEALASICGESGEDSWCYISGPSGFITAAEHACGQIKGLTQFAARWD